jgi:hypothetical protein
LRDSMTHETLSKRRSEQLSHGCMKMNNYLIRRTKPTTPTCLNSAAALAELEYERTEVNNPLRSIFQRPFFVSRISFRLYRYQYPSCKGYFSSERES